MIQKMIEPVVLIVIGILFIYLGKYFLSQYREDFIDDPELTITWETIVQLLSSGTSNGRNAVSCFIAGGLFLAIGLFASMIMLAIIIYGA